MQYHEVLSVIKEGITKTTKDNINKLIELFVQKENDKRVQQLTQGYEALQVLSRNIQKLEIPDLVTYDAHRQKVNGYSKARIDEQNKAKEAFEKLDKAFAAAIEGDFEKLAQALQKKVTEVSE